jgi:voltage-gated potassium channel
MTAQRLSDLDPRHRRLAVLGAATRIALTWVVLVAVYYALPEGKFGSSAAIVRLAVGVLLVFGVFAWQTHRILHAGLPAVRAVVSLAVLIPLFLLVFSALYLSLSSTSPATFSEKLDHSSALYFTITVFSTVGFGDIVPSTDTGRIIVSAQMLLDLVIIGVVVRVLISAAKSGLERARQDSPGTE